MIDITFNLNQLPCISVSDKILPPVNDFNLFEVTWHAWGFLVFATTPAEILGLAFLIQV